MNKLLTVVFVFLLPSGFFSQVHMTSDNSQGTNNRLDSVSIALQKVEFILKESSSIAESTSVLNQKSLIMTKELVELTESNKKLTAELVVLSDQNKESSDRIENLTTILTWLTIVLVGIAVLQIYLELKRRKLKPIIELKQKQSRVRFQKRWRPKRL